MAEQLAASPDSSSAHDEHSSDPAVMGWMKGEPVPADRLVNRETADHLRFPMTRWSFSHMRQFMPTALVSRGEDAPSNLPHNLRGDLDTVMLTPMGSDQSMSFEESLYDNYTDGILVLHKGAIVYERYFGITRPTTRHLLFSVTKSFVGTLAEMLIVEGKLDPEAQVGAMIPELAASGFAGATVRQVMDMTVDLDWSEVYEDATGDIGDYSTALNYVPRRADYAGPTDLRSYLATIRGQGNHGRTFTYRTVNTDVLAWLVMLAADQRLETMLSQRIFAPLGFECDGDLILDPLHTPFAGGGLNICLRDLGRLGLAMANSGMIDGRQALPAQVVSAIRSEGAALEGMHRPDYATLPGFTYRSQWWMMNDNCGAFMGRGIHGQALWIDPTANVVIARFASHPVAGNVPKDPSSLASYRAISAYLSDS